jgi:hypothetical protein
MITLHVYEAGLEVCADGEVAFITRLLDAPWRELHFSLRMPEGFTATRNELARSLRSEGERKGGTGAAEEVADAVRLPEEELEGLRSDGRSPDVARPRGPTPEPRPVSATTRPCCRAGALLAGTRQASTRPGGSPASCPEGS